MKSLVQQKSLKQLWYITIKRLWLVKEKNKQATKINIKTGGEMKKILFMMVLMLLSACTN